MCIIEHKTYIDADGQWTVETPKPCPRATSTQLCGQVIERNVGPIRIVEAAPKPRRERKSTDSSTSAEGFNFGGRVARDISAGSSNRSSARGSTIMSERSTPSSASSPSFVEVKPKVPTPPSAGSTSPPSERIRAPWPPPSSPPVPPTSPPDPRRPVLAGGTAIYDRPPPLDLPRAFENERPRRREPEREPSKSSMKTEANDSTDGPSASRPRRKPTISIDTTLQPSVSSSSTSEEPKRQSDASRPGILRHRSTKDSSRRDSKQPQRERTESEERRREAERDRRYREEEEEQARLERERLAASERRQSFREQQAREDSRARNIRETREALEGVHLDEDPVDAQIDADLAQMAREREAAARRRDSVSSQRTSYTDDRAPLRRRESDARGSNRRYDGRTSPTAPRPRRTNTDGNDPPSPISTRPPPSYPVTVHQPPSTFRERGDEVIAREQARGSRNERYEEEYGRAGDRYIGGDRYVGGGQESGRRRRRDDRRHK